MTHKTTGLDLKLSLAFFVTLSLALVFVPAAIAEQSTSGDNFANSVCTRENPACQKIGSWDFSLAVGLGSRSNPLVDGDKQSILLVPQFSWYGEHFFIDNLEAGYTLLDSSSQMINLLATVSFEQLPFQDDISLGNFVLGEGSGLTSADNDEVPESSSGRSPPELSAQDINQRRLSVLAGIDYQFFHQDFMFNVQLLSDVSGVHHGQEARLALGYDIRSNKNTYSLSTGISWQSREMLNYYYGVNQTEAPSLDFLYEADAGTSGFIQLRWKRKVSKRWSLYSSFHYRQLSNEIKNSPLVNDDRIVTVFAGGVYHF